MNSNRHNDTYYTIIKGSDELKHDELHIIYFKNNKDCIRKLYEIPKNTLTYNSVFEEQLNSFIKEIIKFHSINDTNK